MFGLLNATPKNILVQWIVQKNISEFGRKYLNNRMIDIGCGIKPYKRLLAPFITEHVGLDHKDSYHDASNVDLFGSAYQIPVEDASFDSALCSAVLEHLEEPEQALRECHRVLKQGGIAIYSVPFIWHLHEEPHDFYRFSKYGLEYLFRKVGFEVVEIRALSGFWVTFGQLFVYNMYRINRGPLRWLRIIDIMGLFVQGLSYYIDRMDKTEQWTWMYLVVVRKPKCP